VPQHCRCFIQPMTLGQFTELKLLVPRLLSDQQDVAIRELVRRLEATARIQGATAFLEAALKCESHSPTFVGEGVAVPQVRGAAVQRLSLAIGLSSGGIPWGDCQQHTVGPLVALG
jgi:2-O-A-mannosyl-D-glycerate-specific PTS system IIC component